MTESCPLTIAIVIPQQAQSLDIAGPLAVFREVNRLAEGRALYEVQLIAALPDAAVEIDGMRVLADSSIQSPLPPTDTLLVAGTHAYRQAASESALSVWLGRHAPSVRRLGSVCTGAFFLAAAGLLHGRLVTTHWQQADELAASYPGTVVHGDEIYVQDGKLCTSAGVTAGIDLCLKLVEDDYGRELAMRVARQLVVFLRRPGGQSQFSAQLAAQTADDNTVRGIQQWILENLDADLSLPVLAERAAMSVRNFSRVFRRETDRSPADFVELARVDAAKQLLADSELALQRVASRCGFTNVDLMRRAFIRRLGTTPSDYRKRFAAPLSQ
ncbi:GlxA family transcriptional regulator [Spongiibacter marinus]|uniref:GlxA family transcriptional regulator n=1 Tax=Spongiibacter marinus TaxID=354246 RepID=UPI0035BE205B